jgi:hypothetical protein
VSVRRLLIFLHDVCAAGLGWLLAFWLRFNLDVPRDFLELMWRRLPLVLLA